MNPAAAVIRNRADALKRQARDYKSEHCIDLWGEATASRMALGLHVAARELYRLAEDVEAGKINPEEVGWVSDVTSTWRTGGTSE